MMIKSKFSVTKSGSISKKCFKMRSRLLPWPNCVNTILPIRPLDPAVQIRKNMHWYNMKLREHHAITSHDVVVHCERCYANVQIQCKLLESTRSIKTAIHGIRTARLLSLTFPNWTRAIKASVDCAHDWAYLDGFRFKPTIETVAVLIS